MCQKTYPTCSALSPVSRIITAAISVRVMSAYGPKQTGGSALHMSAFRGQAAMTLCESPLLRSLLGGRADMRCCTAYVR